MKKRRRRPRAPSMAEQAASLWHKLRSDEITVNSRADLARVARARIAFQNQFVNDPQVVELLNAFVAEVEPDLRTAAETLDALAVRRGLQHRGELFVQGDGMDPDIRDIAQRHYQSVVDETMIDKVCAASLGLLIKLGLRWPWLVITLTEQFEARIAGFLTGQSMTLETRTVTLAPRIKFQTTGKESFAAVRASLLETVAILDTMEHAQAGRRPKQDSYLESGAQWLYQHRLCRETIAHLVMQTGKPRQTIERGIQLVDRLLSSTTLTIAPIK